MAPVRWSEGSPLHHFLPALTSMYWQSSYTLTHWGKSSTLCPRQLINGTHTVPVSMINKWTWNRAFLHAHRYGQYGHYNAVINEDVGFMVHSLILQCRNIKKLNSFREGRGSLPHNRFRIKQQSSTGETRWFRGGVKDSVPEALGSEPRHWGKVASHLILPPFMSDPLLINSSGCSTRFHFVIWCQ